MGRQCEACLSAPKKRAGGWKDYGGDVGVKERIVWEKKGLCIKGKGETDTECVHLLKIIGVSFVLEFFKDWAG